jgi:hypothetical protein
MDPLSIYIFRSDIYDFYNTDEHRAEFPTTANSSLFNGNLRNNRYINLKVIIQNLTSTEMTFILRTNFTSKTKTLSLFFPLTITDYPIFQLNGDGKYEANSSDA